MMKTMLPAPTDDIENRLPVWTALSEFYVDNELTPSDLERIGSVCALSPYSREELDEIMFCEVWPAFSSNLMSVAGEWKGWSSEVARDVVLNAYSRRWRLPWYLHPMKRLMRKDWSVVQQLVDEQRAR